MIIGIIYRDIKAVKIVTSLKSTKPRPKGRGFLIYSIWRKKGGVKMNGKEFGNIIDYTIKHMPEDLKGDFVGTVKEIFRNCGIEFYKGSLNEVKEVLETNDYMSWGTCEAEDVKDLADNGVAVVGIKDGEIFIIAPEADFEPEEGHENIRTMSELDEDTIKNIAFFAATNTSTGGSLFATLAVLKEKFPDGKYWNHVGMKNNNPDGYTNERCSSHSPKETCNDFKDPKTGVWLASQCMGFAAKCGYDATRKVYTEWTKYSDTYLNILKPGDIITYYTTDDHNDNATHSIYVTGVSGDTVTYGHCNGYGAKYYCIIKWDDKKTKSWFKGRIKSIWSAPMRLST